MATYTVRAVKDGQRWTLRCVEHPSAVGQARRLSEVERSMRAVIASSTGTDEADIDIRLVIVPPDSIQAHLGRASQLREEAAAANHRAGDETRQAAREMKDSGFTLSEIGRVLGVSRQRAHQLVTEAGASHLGEPQP